MKHLIAATVFCAGTLLAGAAMAQTQTETTVIPPVAHVGSGGHVGNGGYVGPRYTEQVPVAQSAPTVPPTRTTWQSPTGGLQMENPSIGDQFTFALNDLYANGFYHVRPLWMQNGQIGAKAMTPYHVERNVMVNPETGEVSLG